ncbi:transcription factor Spi-C-like [Scleropages formosus]|uniref:transcription factor Spi-C-like n=1 Tax=Scleropages formosus TaxID=113540 RepID=UPI0010FAC11C|nr:transcription factor Spi-C [Scleropages formosus]
MNHLDQDLLNQDFQDAIDVIQRDSDNPQYETESKCYEILGDQFLTGRPSVPYYSINPIPDAPGPAYNWSETPSWAHGAPDSHIASSVAFQTAQVCPFFPLERSGKSRKKLRLYEYLHEALHDVNMADSIQWADRGSGTFHFVSKNKERLAESWGKRKGNRKTMTYQKMARALRNYSRTGEIVKIRRKLTYQFNPVILQRLSSGYTSCHTPICTVSHNPRETLPHHSGPAEQVYYDTLTPTWNGWYGQYTSDSSYDHSFTYTCSSAAKV